MGNTIFILNADLKNQGDLKDFLSNQNIIENVGEFYINSINNDGTGNGLDIELAEF